MPRLRQSPVSHHRCPGSIPGHSAWIYSGQSATGTDISLSMAVWQHSPVIIVPPVLHIPSIHLPVLLS